MPSSNLKTVLVLNEFCYVNGGASRIAIDEAVGLANAGIEVIYFGVVGPVCDELKSAPIKFICLDQPELIGFGKNPTVVLQGLWNAPAAKKMKDILATLDPATTVIHLHGYTKAMTTSPVRMAVNRGFEIVCTLHDYFSACPNGGKFDYVENAPCLRKCMSLDCITANCDKRHYVHKLYRVARSAVQKSAGAFPRGVKNYITLSRQSAALLKPYLPQDAKYFSLENLIETQKSEPSPVSANDHVVAIGRLDPEKGIEVLLEACQQAQVKLTLVGDGPLRAKAESFGNVHVTGWLQPENVMKEITRARCLVFASLWYETYGLVVGEAASRGVPAIVSDVTAAVERVDNGVDGWQFRSGDVADLVRCLNLTKDNEQVQRAGLAAHEKFWSNPPTKDNHLAGLLNIYRQMLTGRTLSSPLLANQ